MEKFLEVVEKNPELINAVVTIIGLIVTRYIPNKYSDIILKILKFIITKKEK